MKKNNPTVQQEVQSQMPAEAASCKGPFASIVILSRYNAGMENEPLTIQSVKNFEDSGKRWLEDVLGQHLKENQQVFIMVFTPGVEPDEASRRQSLAKIKQTMTQVETNLAVGGVTGEEFDAAVDEATEDVRRRDL